MKIVKISSNGKKFRTAKSLSSTCNCGSCNCNCGAGNCGGGFASKKIANELATQFDKLLG